MVFAGAITVKLAQRRQDEEYYSSLPDMFFSVEEVSADVTADAESADISVSEEEE